MKWKEMEINMIIDLIAIFLSLYAQLQIGGLFMFVRISVDQHTLVGEADN